MGTAWEKLQAPQEVIGDGAARDPRQGARQAQRKPETGQQRDKDDAQREKAHHGRGEEFQEGEVGDQKKRQGRDAAEKPGARDASSQGGAAEGDGHLEHPHEDDGRHPHLPGEMSVPGGEEAGADHAEGHAEGGGCVEPQRHRGDVAAPGAPGQTIGEPRVKQVPQEDPDGAAGEHPGEYQVARHPEYTGQDAGHDHQAGHVVQHEPEEGVDIAGGKEPWSVPLHGWHLLPSAQKVP